MTHFRAYFQSLFRQIFFSVLFLFHRVEFVTEGTLCVGYNKMLHVRLIAVILDFNPEMASIFKKLDLSNP
ncbi:hypothetical protein M758_7G082100 [Ceratodon purpureus]|uniref:Uncharacterized protein n=1 Tax=Ceratodon purpureus TaxID=3225 RepID=A0A8T0H6A0_CERPU|nr:hypothetical protein KC19_7G087100 [Ceratodon purpureus]KAG0610661.1 hypothetical protein M758_7G082100 [Ceratodon purpureus]